jgi:hypothetical protein
MDLGVNYPVGAAPVVIAAPNGELSQNFDVKALRGAAKGMQQPMTGSDVTTDWGTF